MKKIMLVIAALIMLSISANAQLFTAGIKAGVSAADVSVRDVVSNPMDYTSRDRVAGYHAGIFSRLSFLGLHLQPELIFTRTGGELEAARMGEVEQLKYGRVDVPIMAGITLFNTLRVQAGPVASFILTAEQEGQTIDSFMDESDWGFQAGVGVDLQRFTLDLRYERIRNSYENGVQQSQYTLENQQLLLSLGYKLF